MQADAATRLVTSTESDVARGQGETRGTRSIWAAVQAPPDDKRRIIELAYSGGWTQGEIADMLPLDTVRNRARTGLLKLRDAPLSVLEARP